MLGVFTGKLRLPTVGTTCEAYFGYCMMGNGYERLDQRR